MTTQQVQLKPEHVAVVSAFERIQAQLGVEAQQLSAVWKQEGAAKELNDLIGKIQALKMATVRDAQMLIRVATEIPNGKSSAG